MKKFITMVLVVFSLVCMGQACLALGFPSNPTILDNFNRDNEGPPMTGWTDLVNGFKVVSNAAIADVTAATNISEFNTAFNMNQEAFVTIVTKGTVNVTFEGVFARLDPAFDGYLVIWTTSTAATDILTLIRLDGGAGTSLGTLLIEKSDGDKLGLRCNGSTIEAWTDTGSGWVLGISRTDSTHNDADNEKVGIDNDDNIAVLDDFGGGDMKAFIPKIVWIN